MLTLSILDEGDLTEWEEFQKKHANKFVRERDPAQLANSAAAGKLFVFRNPQREIRGSCGIFEYGDGTYRETGAVQILDNGFHLQTLIMSAAVFSEWLFDPAPVNAEILAVTALDNHASKKNIERTGFVQRTTLEPSRLEAMNVAGLNTSKVYYTLPESAVPVSRGHLEKVLATGGVQRGDVFLPIKLDIPAIEAGKLGTPLPTNHNL